MPESRDYDGPLGDFWRTADEIKEKLDQRDARQFGVRPRPTLTLIQGGQSKILDERGDDVA